MHAMLYRFVDCVGSIVSASARAVSASASFPALAASSALRLSCRSFLRSTSVAAGRVDGCVDGGTAGAAHTVAQGPIAASIKRPKIARIKRRGFTSNNRLDEGILLEGP